MRYSVLSEDIQAFVQAYDTSLIVPHARFLITGATGLIGSTICKCLSTLRDDIQLVCPVRDLAKVKSVFPEPARNMEFVEGDLVQYVNSIGTDDNISYIIHCASPTNGKFMTEHPVETYMFAVDSTQAILKMAHRVNALGVAYVSSLEYYGQILQDTPVSEEMMGFVDRTSARSCYPLGKQSAEYLCVAYAKQYGVPVKIARLTQTFGAGVADSDNRVFAQFARSVIRGEDIVLHTEGTSAKPYCYTMDAVSGILCILLKGENGEAYNVANEETYISIRDMAEFLRVHFNPGIAVITDIQEGCGYAPVTRLKLKTDKLMALGWQPRYGLYEMFRRMIDYLGEE